MGTGKVSQFCRLFQCGVNNFVQEQLSILTILTLQDILRKNSPPAPPPPPSKPHQPVLVGTISAHQISHLYGKLHNFCHLLLYYYGLTHQEAVVDVLVNHFLMVTLLQTRKTVDLRSTSKWYDHILLFSKVFSTHENSVD